jgi:predicted NAD/FAD-dependent oxidoreductase
MNPLPHIAVIGAGIAGLSCAAALQQAGLAVSLFEKSRGPAGRMSTRRGDDWQCDHGAQYFTARHPDFAAELTHWIQAGVAQQWSPRLQVFGGATSRSPDPAVERFVGVPQMTAPARFMASALTVNTETQVLEMTRRGRVGSCGPRNTVGSRRASTPYWLPYLHRRP